MPILFFSYCTILTRPSNNSEHKKLGWHLYLVLDTKKENSFWLLTLRWLMVFIGRYFLLSVHLHFFPLIFLLFFFSFQWGKGKRQSHKGQLFNTSKPGFNCIIVLFKNLFSPSYFHAFPISVILPLHCNLFYLMASAPDFYTYCVYFSFWGNGRAYLDNDLLEKTHFLKLESWWGKKSAHWKPIDMYVMIFKFKSLEIEYIKTGFEKGKKGVLSRSV